MLEQVGRIPREDAAGAGHLACGGARLDGDVATLVMLDAAGAEPRREVLGLSERGPYDRDRVREVTLERDHGNVVLDDERAVGLGGHRFAPPRWRGAFASR